MAVGGSQVDVGTGTTITFGTSAWTAQLLSLSWAGPERSVVQTTHMATTATVATNVFGTQTFMAVDIAEGGVVTAEVQFNPDAGVAGVLVFPIHQAAETITVTFPKFGTDASAATWAFTGFCTGVDISDPLEEVMTATLTIRVTAGVTITQSVAAA